MVRGILGDKATQIAPNLWQGGYPMYPEAADRIFDVIVLAAVEAQDSPFTTAEVIYAPMIDNDNGPTPDEAMTAHDAAEEVSSALADGKRVLVSCIAGRNRSGLINALVLMSQGLSARQAIRLIRAKLRDALTNPG